MGNPQGTTPGTISGRTSGRPTERPQATRLPHPDQQPTPPGHYRRASWRIIQPRMIRPMPDMARTAAFSRGPVNGKVSSANQGTVTTVGLTVEVGQGSVNKLICSGTAT